VKSLVLILLTSLVGTSFAAEVTPNATPNLPPAEIVIRVLRANPLVQAAGSNLQAEEANRSRLEAGQYEWSVRLGGQQRKTNPNNNPNERFSEWNAALERPLRLPGKAALDAELGAAGVALAETAQGDALHEASRNLLKTWFVWLKEGATATQWAEQLSLLEQQTKSVKRRQQLGDAARLEAIQSEAAFAQADAQLTQARVRERSADKPEAIAEPSAISGSEQEWLAAILKESHELGIARSETQIAQTQAGRSRRDRVPDPTVGVHVSSERSGEDHILGAYISIPLPGGARRSASDAAFAQANAATYREAGALQKITAESAALYQSANAALATWQASRNAAESLTRAANMTARAYQLGEGNLNELLAARRLANEAQLAARLLQLEALELRYRLLLDAHQLWDFD
jgi:outer membrane protein TolC